MSVIGIDPGTSGALAHYFYEDGTLQIDDLPTWYMMINKKSRKRIDAVKLIDYFEMAKMLGCELVVIEAVGGRPRQSASSGFAFGYTVGLIYMACVAVRLPIETAPSMTWKRLMKVPGKRDGKVTDKEKTGAIIARADEVFPEHRDTWRGPKGGYRLDRAEAALISRYAADFALRSVDHTSDWKTRMLVAETGG